MGKVVNITKKYDVYLYILMIFTMRGEWLKSNTIKVFKFCIAFKGMYKKVK